MYKRRKRRASNKKGKKQAAVAMSVTTMEVVDNHQTLPVQVQPESKAVGARKRKPTTISKIVEKPLSDMEMDYCAGDSVMNQNNNNNNCPPYKKPCLEPGKNGIIRNILTELKSAKEASNRLDVHVLVKDSEQEREEDEGADEDNGVSEGENSLRIEEDEDDDGFSYDGCGNERAKSGGRTRSLPGLKKRMAVDYSFDRSRRERDGGEKSDLADIKSILSNTGVSAFGRSNGIDGKDAEGDDDESANEEGTDLRSITGNSTGDDELPFRCGVCAYGSCDKSTLLRHMRTHSGERPFQCRLCYFAFTTKANCERHLRNRHFQVDRDQLRNLVVCLPTSSNASESETESNHGATQNIVPPILAPSIPAQISMASSGSSARGSILDDDLPLDLSMDAVDLSTKRRDGNSIFSRKSSLHRPRPVYPAPEVNNILVTSPFVSKREPLVHPQLPINSPFTPHSLSQSAAAPGSRAAFSLFPFGAPPGFNPFGIPPANVEKLISMGAGSPPKMPNPFLGASPTPAYGSKESNTTTVEKETIIKQDIVESKRVESNTNTASSVSPTANNRKRSDNNNGEYQKPKQRRYRTERPFACPHCPARFTLRSNMERHGKHQHPTVWQRSPSNRVINRQKNQQSPLVGPPTMVHSNKFSNSSTAESKSDKNDSGMNVNVRAVIAQQLKRKLSNSSLRNNVNGSDTETDAENTNENGKMSGGDDLASVERLLDRVNKTSNFAQYFNDEGNNMSVENNSEDNEDRSCDESGGEGMSGSEPEEGDSKASGGEKKKSAYSSAPHKISCPHCSRRFPWTSSLRRHLLTHTGQKPYQCSKCPLLFTTKSNCDRHLARKHNGQNVKNASDNSTEEDEEDEDGEDEHEEEEEDKAPETEIVEVTTPAAKTTPKTPMYNGSSPGEDAAFRCHLCEAAAGEREVLLSHMEEEHKETFHMLVSKGALSSSPTSENSETELALLDQKDVTHRKVMCVFCVRRFWSVEDLRRHIRSHSGERPFSCPHCSRRFTLKHSMLRHLKKHSNSSTPTRNKASLVQPSQNNLKNSDLIGRLLGISDDRLVEQLLNKPDAKDAAKILGLGNSQAQHQTPTGSKC